MSRRPHVLIAALVAAAVIGATVWHLRTDRSPRAASSNATPVTPATAPPDATFAQATEPTARARVDATLALPPRPPGARAFMPELRKAADAGDAVAACKLAVALGRCSERKRLELGASMGEGIAPGSPVSSLDAPADDCSAASERDLDDRYRYQAQAFASGTAATERWFVQQPMLSDDDFRMNTANAIDFRRRAPAYVARALQRRSVDDLKLLLQVYMPPGYFDSSSPLRLRDDAMFLALADVAEQAGISPEYVRATAAQVRRRAGADVIALSRQRAAQVGGPWGSTTPAAPSAPAESLDNVCEAAHRG